MTTIDCLIQNADRTVTFKRTDVPDKNVAVELVTIYGREGALAEACAAFARDHESDEPMQCLLIAVKQT